MIQIYYSSTTSLNIYNVICNRDIGASKKKKKDFLGLFSRPKSSEIKISIILLYFILDIAMLVSTDAAAFTVTSHVVKVLSP